jgi:hypothetical protein
VRLTLRTLLAYLDDTLEPAQAKLIGQKVAESDTAQELIARIKQVTRRRRLTTPPVAGAGNKTDPNTIAEYLDNTLPSEQLGEVEEICLASDVHLAEIAACHQILTLVLGEPALVPPTSRQRMYALVKGPEAIPFRKAASPLDTGDGGADDGSEDDETLRLGLPAYRRHAGWAQPLAIVAGGLALVALLVVAIWNLLPHNPRSDKNANGKDSQARADGNRNTDSSPPNKKDSAASADKKRRGKKPSDGAARDGKKKSKDKRRGQTSRDGRKDGKRGTGDDDDDDARDRKPSRDKLVPDRRTDRTKIIPVVVPRPIARFEPPDLAVAPILLRREQGKEQWHRLERNQREVKTGDTLVSLPGYRSSVHFIGGLDLMLWGDLWEFNLLTPVLESAVVVNEPGRLDLDLTLDHGRIIITNPDKDKALVRVRFANPTVLKGMDSWDITLQGKGAQVGLELWGRYPPGARFNKNEKSRLGPQTELYLFVLKKKALVQIEDTTHAMQAPPEEADEEPDLPGMVVWNSTYGVSSPKRNKQLPEWGMGKKYGPLPKDLSPQVSKYLTHRRRDMETALDELSRSMIGKKVDVTLEKEVKSANSIKRVLIVRCFGAIGDLSSLLDRLTDENYPDVRQAAIEVLRHWIALHKDNDLKLHRVLIKEKGYSAREADTILHLLHSFSRQDLARPETYSHLIDYLRQDKPAIRILAHWHLIMVVPTGREIKIDPINDGDVDLLYKKWKVKVPEGSLPKVPKAKRKPDNE